jgi:hypothetical protein
VTLRLLIWYVPALASAAMFGVAAGLGGKTLSILVVGAMGGLILLFAPLGTVLGLFLVLTFLVVGPITSIARVGQAAWVPYMLAFVLLTRTPMEWYHSSSLRDRVFDFGKKKLSPLSWPIAFYFIFMAISAAVNGNPPLQLLIGAKLYVFVWGTFFLLVVSSVCSQDFERMWWGLLVTAVLQLPFALYQRFVEVPSRVYAGGITALDAIVGTFPGGEGGGSSGALATFLVFSMALAVSLMRNKLLGQTKGYLVIFASLITIALGEVKVVIILFPLAYLILNRMEVVRRPLQFVALGITVVSILGGILLLYQSQTNVAERNRGTLAEHIEASFGYIVDVDNIRYDNGEVGRVAGLYLWYRNPHQTPQSVLFGYGPAASQDSTVQRGEVARRYLPLIVNSTTAAGMLWDIGVLGFASFIALLVVAFFEALKLYNCLHIPVFHRSVLESCAVLFAVIGVTLVYNNDMLITAPLQLLFLLALVEVVYWRANSN